MSHDIQDMKLDKDLAAAIASGLTPPSAHAPTLQALRQRILERAANTPNVSPSKDPLLNTIRADQGDWLQVGRGVDVKPLFENAEGHSYLVRLQPGATLPVHPHGADEECLVMEGELHLGDLHFRAGDFHVARAGSTHAVIRSSTGATMYIRSSGTPAYRL